jgi:hypothetical protein
MNIPNVLLIFENVSSCPALLFMAVAVDCDVVTPGVYYANTSALCCIRCNPLLAQKPNVIAITFKRVVSLDIGSGRS